MEFPIRDKSFNSNPLRSQSGQAITEYILILVTVVGLALGVIYQFNDAFRQWANAYFSQYVACLLETAELPYIDGAPGDSGTCKDDTKFALNNGKPLIGKGGTGNSSSSSNKTGGPKETANSGTHSSSSSSHNSSFSSSGRSSSGSGAGGGGPSGKKIGSDSSYTGSTATGNYGGGYGTLNKRLNTGVKYRVDNRYAFEDEKEQQQTKTRTPSANKSSTDASNKVQRSRVRNKPKSSSDTQAVADSSFTLGNFLRFLIIAAIIIGLIIFLGGQLLQINKSME